jgi:polyisoprenoid-binding protein YceI
MPKAVMRSSSAHLLEAAIGTAYLACCNRNDPRLGCLQKQRLHPQPAELLEDLMTMTRVVAGDTLPVAGTWTIDPSHSTVGFSVRHLGLAKVRGTFQDFTGDIVIAEDPTASSVAVEVQVASIDTRDAGRDEHLRNNDFFDVPVHPTMTFTSTSVSGSGADWKVTGDLTIRGVTRQVVLDATFEGTAGDPWGGSRAAFSATTEVNREDFGVSWNAPVETGGVLVGKKVKLEIEAEAVLQAPAA